MIGSSSTDKLVTGKGKGNSNSSYDELESLGTPSGTFSGGVDLTLDQSNLLVRLQAKSNISALTRNARDYIKTRRNKKQRAQATRVLGEIENLLKGYESVVLPEIRARSARDGSLGISWAVQDTLFGVAIQRDTDQSSWFLLQGDVEEGFRADGYLNEYFYENQLPSMLNLLIKAQPNKGEENDIAS